MSVEATFHKNALIKNLVILFVFFCAVEPVYSFFFKPIGFFWFNLNVFFGRYWKQLCLILCQFGYFLSRIPFLRYLTSTFQGFDLDLWLLTFRSHLRSKICRIFKILYKTTYLTSIDTFPLSCTVFEIFNIKVFKVWPWPLTFKGQLRSKLFSLFERAHTWLPI